MTEFLNIGEFTLKNTTIKKISTNIYDKTSDVELPSVKKSAELAALANTHDDVVMTDTIYLFEDSTGRIFDNTYNCQWTVSPVDNSFYPYGNGSTNFNDFCKLANGDLFIPSKAIYKNRKYYLRPVDYSNISNVDVSVSVSSGLITFALNISSLSSYEAICFRSNYFEKAGIDIGFSSTNLSKFYKDPTCKNSLSAYDENVEMVDTDIFVPHYEYLYTKSLSIGVISYGNYPSSFINDLTAAYSTSSTKVADCVRYTYSDIYSLGVNIDYAKNIMLSNEFTGKLNLKSSLTNTTKIFVDYPKYDLTSSNISKKDSITYLPLHLKINETYKDAGLSANTTVAANNNVTHLWLTMLFFNNEDVETATAGQFGNFSGFSSKLKCLHVPKELLTTTSKTYSDYVTHLKTVFKITDLTNCKIGFY